MCGIRIFQGLLCRGFAQSQSSLGTEPKAALAGALLALSRVGPKPPGCGTWGHGGLGSARGMVGLDDRRGFSNLDSMEHRRLPSAPVWELPGGIPNFLLISDAHRSVWGALLPSSCSSPSLGFPFSFCPSRRSLEIARASHPTAGAEQNYFNSLEIPTSTHGTVREAAPVFPAPQSSSGVFDRSWAQIPTEKPRVGRKGFRAVWISWESLGGSSGVLQTDKAPVGQRRERLELGGK